MRHVSRRLLYFLACLALLAACQGSPQPLPGVSEPTATPQSPAPAMPTATPVSSLIVAIDVADTRQTLREVGGGNYIHRFGGIQTGLDPISLLNVETLQPQVVRTRIDLDEWEPTPGLEGNERFQDTGFVNATFDFMQQVKDKTPQVIIAASIWEVPDWMVSNPNEERNRIIPPERYPQVVESIAQWLLHARDQYGVEVAYVSFNEANIGVNILLSSQDQVELIRIAGPRFRELGLNTLWLLGDTANLASAVTYIPPIYAAEDIRPYLGPLSFHSWDSQVSDHVLRSIGKYADENGLEVWCTEGGWDPQQWNRRNEFSTWKHAFKMANIYTRVLRDTRATTLLYWQMMGEDYYINDGSKPFPALIYLDELQRHFPAGSQIVATPDDEIQTLSVLSLAANTLEGSFSVELINQIVNPKTVVLTGLPDGSYTMTRLSEADGGLKSLGKVEVESGRLELILDGHSINFLMLER